MKLRFSNFDAMTYYIEINNSFGETVYKRNAAATAFNISLKSFSNGIYYLSVKSEKIFEITKFIKFECIPPANYTQPFIKIS